MPDFLDNKVSKLSFIKIGDKKTTKPSIQVTGKKKYETSIENTLVHKSDVKSVSTKFNVQQVANDVSQKALKMIPFSKAETNPNSFSSIFNRDHQHVSGVKRVFRKSFTVLAISVLAGEAILLLGLSLFTLNPIYLLAAAITYSVFTNIFFIILADRSYFWISLFSQLILSILAYLFMGYGLTKISVAILFAICVLIYFAYSEIEKVQLSSRLFSISSVTSEATRILSTVIILFICLSSFNKATHDGSDVYIRDNFLNNTYIMDNFIIGNNSKFSSYSLNRFLANTKYIIDGNSVKYRELSTDGTIVLQNATLKQFLTLNYRPNEDLISKSEKDDIQSDCERKNETNCDAKIEALKLERLDKWKKEAYPTITWPLKTELSVDKYRDISKQFYMYEIRSFNTDKSSNAQSSELTQSLAKYLFLPRNQILPTLLVILIFIALTLLRPFYNLAVFICTLFVWQLLKFSKFIRIEVETVEAEVVGI